MDKQLNNNQKLNTRGNKDATWDDVDCKHLNEDKTCQLASELANLPHRPILMPVLFVFRGRINKR